MKFKHMNRMEIGTFSKLPHYSVVGDKTRLYIWVDEDGRGSNSKWITGYIAFQLWNELKAKFKKDKLGFVELLKKQHELNS